MSTNAHRPTAGSAAANQYGVFSVQYATDKQVAYLRSLFAQRNPADAPADLLEELNETFDRAREGKVSKKAASRAIDALLSMPVNAPAPEATERTYVMGASDKQAALIERLEAERESGWNATRVNAAMETRKGASEYIDYLFTCPRRETKGAGADPEAGMYWLADGTTIVRVYLGQNSGRMLAKRVVGNKTDGFSYEYEGLASKVLAAGAERMTLAEAKAWGRMTGTCCVCAARLDNPESVDAGIGPVCSRKFA